MLTVIYDGQCRVCTTLVGWLKRTRAGDRLEARPNQTPGVTETFGLTRTQVDQEVWAIGPDGRRWAGAAAANRILSELGGPWKALAALYRVRPIRWVEDRFYHWFSARRYRFGCAGDHCALPGSHEQPR